jgi:hypothetical protein
VVQSPQKNKGPLVKKACFSLVTMAIVFILIELLLRLLVKPCNQCCGEIMGTRLPPFTLAPPVTIPIPDPPRKPEKAKKTRTADACRLIDQRAPGKGAEGEEVFIEDLIGHYREDPVSGYGYLEDWTSQHRWWHSNNRGARNWEDTEEKKNPGRKRILAFGDSFTVCSQVPQLDSWPSLMEEKKKSLQVVNFGVDGYGMGQCLLRYEKVSAEIDFDNVIMVFVPSCDLERDINTYRRIMGWDSWQIMPRYILEEEKLALIRGPYDSSRSFLLDNQLKLSEKCFSHIRKYDRLYIPTKFESPPLLGDLILYKLVIGSYNNILEGEIHRKAYTPGSEALAVSRGIFEAMNEEVKARGKTFLLFLLPRQDEVEKYRRGGTFRKEWDSLSAYIGASKTPFVDFMKPMMTLPADQFDRAHDGYHNGKKTNGHLADFIIKALEEQGKSSR